MFEDEEIKELEVEVCNFFSFDFPHITFYDHVTEFLVIGCLLPHDTVNLEKLFGDGQNLLDRSEEVFGLMTEYMQKKIERKLRENSIDIMETILEFYDSDPDSQREAAFLVITIARELCCIETSKSDTLQRKFNISIKNQRRFLEAIERVISNFEESSTDMISGEEEESLSTMQICVSNDDTSDLKSFRDDDSLDSFDKETKDVEKLDSKDKEKITFLASDEYGSLNKDGVFGLEKERSCESTYIEFKKDVKFGLGSAKAFSQKKMYPVMDKINFKKSIEQSPKILHQTKSKSTIKILPRIQSQRSAIKKKAANIISSVNNLNFTLSKENTRFRASVSPDIQNCYKINDKISKTSKPVVDYSWRVEARDPSNNKFISPRKKSFRDSIKTLTMTKSYAFEKRQFKQHKAAGRKEMNAKRCSLEPQALAGLIRKSLKKENFKAWPFKKSKNSRLKSGKILTQKERQMKSFDQSIVHKSIQSFHFSKVKKSQVAQKKGLTDRRRITMSPCIKNGLKLALINCQKSSKKSVNLKSYTTKKFSIYDRIPSNSPSKYSKISSCSAFDSVTLYKKKKRKDKEANLKERETPAICPSRLKLSSVKPKISFMSPGDRKIQLCDIKSTRISSIRSSKFGKKMKFEKFTMYTDRSAKSRTASRQKRKFQVSAIKKILDKPRTGFKKLKSSIINSTKSYKLKGGKENSYGFSAKVKKFPEPGSFLKASSIILKKEEELGIGKHGKIKNSKIMNLLRKKRSRDILKQFDKNKDGKQKFSFTNRARLHSPNFDKLRLPRDTKKPKVKTEIGILSSRFKNTSYFDIKGQRVAHKSSLVCSSTRNKDEKPKNFLKENFDLDRLNSSGKKISLEVDISNKKKYMKKIYGLKEEILDFDQNEFELCR